MDAAPGRTPEELQRDRSAPVPCKYVESEETRVVVDELQDEVVKTISARPLMGPTALANALTRDGESLFFALARDQLPKVR
jgi:hypothetical protein